MARFASPLGGPDATTLACLVDDKDGNRCTDSRRRCTVAALVDAHGLIEVSIRLEAELDALGEYRLGTDCILRFALTTHNNH